MKVSLVKESKPGEKRALLLPEQISDLSKICHLQVESNTGEGLGISDTEYKNAGAKIVDRETAWKETDIILKLKCPSLEEAMLITDGRSIAGLLHAEVAPDLIDLFLKKKIRSYSFEYFSSDDGNFPLMKATGEISGKQAVIYAAYHLQSHLEGSGIFLPSTQHVQGAKVAIIGFGNVGQAAADAATALGADVIIFRWGISEINSITINSQKVNCFPCKDEFLKEIIPQCDVVIGAIRISTFDTPVVLDHDLIKQMKKGSVLVDVTAGYGPGYIATSVQRTFLNEPFNIVNGVKHIKIRELPLGVHVTSAIQISRIYGPYILKMIESINSKKMDPVSEKGLITFDGKIVNTQIAKHFNKRFKE